MKKTYLSLVIAFSIIQASHGQFIRYIYKGPDPIADTAEAVFGKNVVARAWVLEVIRIPKDVDQVLIREEHYIVKDRVIYEGLVRIRFGVSGNMVIEEKKIRGKRPRQIFKLWPSEIDARTE